MKKYTPSGWLWGFFVAVFCCNMAAMQGYALEESTGSGGSNASAVHQLGQTGEGVNIGLILGRNVRTTHEAFKDGFGISHAFNYDFSGDGILIDWHDTRLAGIISSRGGASHPNDIGVAPGADIYCARVADNANGIEFSELDSALDELINTHNCRIIITGFEILALNPNGDSVLTLLYDYYAYQTGAVFANAAGNEDSFVSIFGDAYNGITTGGLRLIDPANEFDYRRVGTISGEGLTDDGRRKPDITAPSQNQTVPNSSSDTDWVTTGTANGETSWSVPHTAGAAALLLGLADNTPGPNDNRSEVIKAVIVNSAMPNINDKDDNFTNPADSNNTWHNQRGYGRLDALRAYQTLNTAETETTVTITQDRGWAFGRLSQGQTDSYTINITIPCRLIATLAWHRRVTGTLNAHMADLDMIIYSPYEPNPIFDETTFNLNPNDNLEKCDLLVSSPGDYTILIDNDSTNGESADYGLAFELHPIMTGDLPDIDYIVDFYDFSTLASQWQLAGTEIDWILSPNGIIDFADLAELAYNWLLTDQLYYTAQ